MSRRLRVTGVLAALGAGTMLLSAAVPTPGPATFAQPRQPAAATRANAPVQPARPPSEPPPGALPADAALSDLKALAKGGTAEVDRTGTIRGITAAPGKTLGDNSAAFLTRYAAAFGLSKGHTLDKTSTAGLPGGDEVTRYQQKIGGVPVLGGEVILTTSGQAVRSAVADAAYLNPVDGKLIGTAAAHDKAAKAAAAQGLTSTVTATSEVWLYQAPGRGELRPTYWVKLGQQGDENETASVLVDGLDGAVSAVAPRHRSAGKDRIVCDQQNRRFNLNSLGEYKCTSASLLGAEIYARPEGQGPSASSQVNQVFDRLGVVYDWYYNNFGLNSFNGKGAQIRANVNGCDLGGSCPMVNAFWDSSQFVFGQGWGTDDVVGHEFTHAVTEYSSNLYYWHESGAINEALSDIFGEFIDLATPGDGTDDTNKRWHVGENIPASPSYPSGGAIRNMMNPNIFGDPSTVYGSGWVSSDTDGGGVHSNSGPANRLAAMLYDGAPGVAAIGPQKSAQLWFRVMHVLPSGADYRDLGVAIKSACRDLIGKTTTPADCDAVSTAYSVISPSTQDAINVCEDGSSYGTGRLPSAVHFADDMEAEQNKWYFSHNVHWIRLPHADAPYSYATSGQNALNGWGAGSGSSGTGTYIETRDWISIPPATAGVTPWVGFQQSLYASGYYGSSGVKLLVNDGTGWKPLEIAPSWASGNFMNVPTRGYQFTRASLAAYTGKSVLIRFELSRGIGQIVDWYLDDFSIVSCHASLPGAPQDAYAYKDGTDLKVTWKTALYQVDPATPVNYHFELTYDPPIPGAPATYRPEAGQSGDLRRMVAVPGADLSKNYQITIRVKQDTGAMLLGPATTIFWTPFAPANCPSGPVETFLPSPTGKCMANVAVPRM
ncbi:M4 family metallopeptidase [Catelliglobosispora koreensis]|uniref:M4 family metallopeptidase n=1 Tax=Catelliglobosispora koreensis TaxID=129052 RepID=UPI000377F133|nr:M4 family metallopeptidase [Catelliglobosispora koreensis]